MLSDSIPKDRVGVYMGVFNMFIVIPQIVAATLLGLTLKTFFGNQPIYALMISGASLIVGALCLAIVREPKATYGGAVSTAH